MITLTEYESLEVPLSVAAYNVLHSQYAGKIDVGVTERVGVYRITARDYVGRIGLPDGGALVIQPKVGVGNLFYMLCVDAGLASFYTRPTWLAPDTEIYSFVVELLVRRVEELLRAGLYRAYVPVQEDLPFVRGRIALNEQLRLHGDLKDRHVCAYADLTADTAENRVILAALRLLPTLLRGRDEAGLVRRVRALLPRFEGVSVVSRGQALGLARGMSFHRLNAACAPAIGLCRLALQHLTLEERAGNHPFASFLVDMPRLFESFVTARLKEYLARHGLRVVAQRHDYLDEGRQVGIRPDVLVYARGDVTPLLVLDAKYRRMDGEDGLNRDLYQVSAYLDRYRLSRGVLVYPQFGDASSANVRLRGTPKSLHLLTLNLDTSDTKQLERNCAALAEEVAHLSLGLNMEN
jgi:5-methylcytosine-specific restriction enzyme subunit McrC